MSLTVGIHHLGLTVSKLEETASFFIHALEFTLVKRDKNYPSIFVTDGTNMVTLWQANGDSAVEFDRKKNVGLHHVAFTVASLGDLAQAFAQAANHPGVTVEFSPELLRGGPAQHCMLLDPSGIRVELIFAG
ncbi:MAG: VOC family protein [SAR324 cluster bacterium]|nr:VOC family protein [SAR324 cluster bacterium]